MTVVKYTNPKGDLVSVRNGYQGKDNKYDLCQMNCAIKSILPEGCNIRRELDKIERIHNVRVPVWECGSYRVQP